MNIKPIRVREFKDKNYRSIYFNGKTLRQQIDNSKPIEELDYPEFYDISVTSKCYGNCPECYMDSKESGTHYNAIENIRKFFGSMTDNQRPHQLAIGGGECTLHPDFCNILKEIDSLGITPNYTTNGMHLTDEIIEATKKYCGGVAISCHPHLQDFWRPAADKLVENGIMLNFHIIISDKESVDYFMDIFIEYHKVTDYFVLLPHMEQGRAGKKVLEHQYLFEKLDTLNTDKIAFGANFYEYIKDTPSRYNISIYEPEIMSKYLDLKDMKIYKSSFHLEECNNEKLNSHK